MRPISVLANVHLTGQFGDYENKKENELLKISEKKNLLIVQIVQFKNSNVLIESIDIDGLKLKDSPLNVAFNENTRILWNGPKNWLLVSSKKDLIKSILVLSLKLTSGGLSLKFKPSICILSNDKFELLY